MAEPDRTNADAERVSDIVKPVAWRWRNSSHGIVSGWFYAEEEPSFAPRDLDRIDGLTPLYTADIIEAQSKALAEAREAFDEMSRECINGLMNDIMRVEELLRGTKAGANPESMRTHLARCQELAAKVRATLTEGAPND